MALSTVREVEELTPSAVAEMVVPPGATVCANPSVSMTATAGLLLCQLTSSLIGEALPSENRPVASYWTGTPLGTISFAGSMSMATRMASVTVTGVLSLTPSKITLTVAPPLASSSVKPPSGPVGTTVATAGSDEVQVAVVVTSWLLPSV